MRNTFGDLNKPSHKKLSTRSGYEHLYAVREEKARQLGELSILRRYLKASRVPAEGDAVMLAETSCNVPGQDALKYTQRENTMTYYGPLIGIVSSRIIFVTLNCIHVPRCC